MSGLPEITITGTMVANPEIKYLDSGACVANFTLAANDRRFDREQGAWVDASATFLRCSIWRHEAENVTETLSQGDRVLATGTLKQRSWQTPDGDKRTVLEMAVTEIGPSLKFATANVSKVKRTADPDRSAAPAGASADQSKEPPF